MTHRWSIRSRIRAMLAIPIAMLVVVWLFAVGVTLRSALDLRDATRVRDAVTGPVAALVAQLQVERRLTALFVAGGRANGPAVLEQRARSDEAVARFRALATDTAGTTAGTTAGSTATGTAADGAEGVGRPVGAGDATRRAFAVSVPALDGLARLRQLADTGGDAGTVRQGYGAIIAATDGIGASVTGRPDAEAARAALGGFTLGLVRELFSREDALVTQVTAGGELTAALHTELVAVVAQQRLMLPYAAGLLPPEDRVPAAGGAVARLAGFEDRLLAAAPGPAAPVGVDLGQWRAAFDAVSAELAASEARALSHSGPAALDASLVRVGVVAVGGLLAVVLALVWSVRVGRPVARRLDRLRTAARELAEERLPAVVARLRQGGGEPGADAAAGEIADEAADEFGEIGRAFDSVRRTAVAAAAEEAAARHGMGEVFLNIARRSQVLLHRQLSLLDGMERRTTDPGELADLFRVDHLATRMRRHAEDVAILAGAAPSRGWRRPVPVIDVVRGAVSEVEEYARVHVRAMAAGAVAGRAVGDVIHLLAELLENATAYSPPHTRVRVSAQAAPDGFMIEVEDGGLGMAPAAVADANRRLADPSAFDPAHGARLGLFVVARLAARHGVRVVLRESPLGGVTAAVLLPVGVVVPPRAVVAGSTAPAVGLLASAVPAVAPYVVPEVAPFVEPGVAAPGSPSGVSVAAVVVPRALTAVTESFSWLTPRDPTPVPVPPAPVRRPARSQERDRGPGGPGAGGAGGVSR